MDSAVTPTGFYSGQASGRNSSRGASSVTPNGRRPRMNFRSPSFTSGGVSCGVRETVRDHYQPRQALFDTFGLSSPPAIELEDDYDEGASRLLAADDICIETADQRSSRRLPLSGSSQFNRTLSTTSQPYANVDVVELLQQQQAMIQKVLTQQELIQEKQLEFDHKLHAMEERLQSAPSSTSTSGSSPDKPKVRVPHDLTVSTYNFNTFVT